MSKLVVRYQPVAELKPRLANPRTHSDKQIRQIVRSIEKFGFTNPILVDERGRVVAGHGRLAAAKLMGLEQVPTLRFPDMSEADVRAYVIADNKIAENAGWDEKLLAIEFQYLSSLDIDLDLTITGFDLPEIDVRIASLDGVDADPADQPTAMPEGPPTSRLGDVWLIGRHRLVCGDATQARPYEMLLRNEKAQMVFADNPYNVSINGHVGGSGAIQHREFAMASGEMTSAEFTAFLVSVFRLLAAWSGDGAVHYQCMDWRHVGEILRAGADAYTELKNICVWSKTNAGMGSLYRSQHEFVLVFKSGKAPHINNIELGKHGRHRTNVWSYAGVNSWGQERANLVDHPTVKPVALVSDAILDCSKRKGIVLDPFVGSGTTLIAAERTGRVGRAIELDPIYCDRTVARLHGACGLEATLEETGETFQSVQNRRLENHLTRSKKS